MARKKVKTLLLGIAYDGDALVLFPSKYGKDLPVLQRKRFWKKNFLRDLAEYGFEGVSIVDALPVQKAELEGEETLLEAYVISYDKLNLEHDTLPLDAGKEGAPTLASRYLEMADVYAPLFQQKQRTVPLLPPEQKKVDEELECLRFYRAHIDSRALRRFERLCDSAASMRRINAAFAALCNGYHIHPKNLEGDKKARLKKKKR